MEFDLFIFDDHCEHGETKMTKEEALIKYLGLGEHDVISMDDDGYAIINPRRLKSGPNIFEVERISTALRAHLERAGFPAGAGVAQLKNDYIYWRKFVPDSPMHQLINALYFLTNGADESYYYCQMLHMAFNGETVKDLRGLHGVDDGEYTVLTDIEASEAVNEHIEWSLLYFKPGFLSEVTGIHESVVIAVQKSEDEDAMIELVGDKLQDVIYEAVEADGRGHFLSSYDGEEIEEGEYYIYRTG